jgi:hypothetical protein
MLLMVPLGIRQINKLIFRMSNVVDTTRTIRKKSCYTAHTTCRNLKIHVRSLACQDIAFCVQANAWMCVWKILIYLAHQQDIFTLDVNIEAASINIHQRRSRLARLEIESHHCQHLGSARRCSRSTNFRCYYIFRTASNAS